MTMNTRLTSEKLNTRLLWHNVRPNSFLCITFCQIFIPYKVRMHDFAEGKKISREWGLSNRVQVKFSSKFVGCMMEICQIYAGNLTLHKSCIATLIVHCVTNETSCVYPQQHSANIFLHVRSKYLQKATYIISFICIIFKQQTR